MPPIQNTIPDNSTLSKPKPRGKLKHALIDVNFFNSPNVIALRRKFGPAAPGAIVAIICQLSQTLNAELNIDTALGVMDLFKIDNAEECLNYCFESEILQKINDRLITHNSVIKDQESCARKRAKWRGDKDKQNNMVDSVADSTVESVVDSAEKCEYMNTEDLDPEDLNLKEGGQGETIPIQSSVVQNKPPKIQFGEHVFLTQTEIDNVQNKHGMAFFERCCEKLDAWIEQDPTPKRRKNGKNAGATFRAWVLNAVAEEEVRASRTTTRAPPYQQKLSNAEKTMMVYREIEAEELAKMGMKDEQT